MLTVNKCLKVNKLHFTKYECLLSAFYLLTVNRFLIPPTVLHFPVSHPALSSWLLSDSAFITSFFPLIWINLHMIYYSRPSCLRNSFNVQEFLTCCTFCFLSQRTLFLSHYKFEFNYNKEIVAHPNSEIQ